MTLKMPFFQNLYSCWLMETDADGLRAILEKEIDNVRGRHSIGKGVLESMGTVAPAFGMMGTLIGLVLMLRELDDPSKIGVGMATALITTFYGVLLANLIFLPMSGKLDIRSKEETLLKELIVEGVVSIQSGDNPSIVEEKLKGFLSPSQRKEKKMEVLKDQIRNAGSIIIWKKRKKGILMSGRWLMAI